MIRVLHIDIDPNEHYLLSHSISKVSKDIAFSHVSSAREALIKLNEDSFDCILSDFQMPEMSGLELLQKLKAENSKIPFIFITGQGSEELAINALRAGADDYFTKDRGFAHFERIVNSIEKHSSHAKSEQRTDILKKEEEKDQAGDEGFKIFFENNIIVMLIIDYTNGQIIDANKAAAAFYNWSREELRSKNIAEINTLPQSSLAEKMAEVHSEGSKYFEFEHRKADGSISNVNVHSGPIILNDRELIYSIVIDASQHRKTESELKNAGVTLAEAERLLKMGSWIWNRDENEVHWSPGMYQMCGRKVEQGPMSSAEYLEIVHPDDRDKLTRAIEQSFETGLYQCQYRQRNKDDQTYRYIKARGDVEITKPTGTQCHFGVATDITDQVIAEEKLHILNTELKEANSELESFGYSVFRDLKAPTRQLVGFINLLEKSLSDGNQEESAELIKNIKRTGSNVKNLIEAIRSLSTVHQAEMKFETVDVSKLAEEIKDDLATIYIDHHVEMRIQSAMKLKVDKARLKVLLENLIGNARKFTCSVENPTITIGLESRTDKNTLFIEDNGIGFDPRKAKEIFKPFSRLVSDVQFPGTGIGLATVNKIVKQHAAEIRAIGKPDKGARFEIDFPVLGENQ